MENYHQKLTKNQTQLKMPSNRITNINTPFSPITGWILVAALFTSIISGFEKSVPGYFSGILVWCAAILALASLKKNQIIQNTLLLSIGMGSFLTSIFNGINKDYIFKLLEANQQLVAMIVSVSFLRIATHPRNPNNKEFLKGSRAIINTLLGSHLVSSVINLSSIIIVADNLSNKKPLTLIQGVILIRAFSTCAL